MENQDSFLAMNFFFLGSLGILLTVIILTVPNLRQKLIYLLARIHTTSMNYTPIKYLEQEEEALTLVSKRRLGLVSRKTLVLDMDETLISSVIIYHSSMSKSRRTRSKLEMVANLPCDYKFFLPGSNATIHIYKRPHVDFFLDCVSKWYNLVIFTAATEEYASRVLDYLDAGRKILTRRMYRHDCINICGIWAKFVSMANGDLANVLLLDDCHMENSFNMGNSVHIRSYRIGTKDDQLLCMLPFLDALRFTHDVRSILGRRTRYDCLTTCLRSLYDYEEDTSE